MNIIRHLGKIFAVAALLLATSCAEEVCYDCVGFDAGGSMSQDTLICSDQFDTRQAFDNQVEVYEALGGICNQQ